MLKYGREVMGVDRGLDVITNAPSDVRNVQLACLGSVEGVQVLSGSCVLQVQTLEVAIDVPPHGPHDRAVEVGRRSTEVQHVLVESLDEPVPLLSFISSAAGDRSGDLRQQEYVLDLGDRQNVDAPRSQEVDLVGGPVVTVDEALAGHTGECGVGTQRSDGVDNFAG